MIQQPSWDDMMAWITASQGELEEVMANRLYCGPVQKVSDHHAVQKVGRRTYTVHTLNELDKIPALNSPETTIRYRDGRGYIMDDASDDRAVTHERDILAHELKKSLSR
jgi:hypothetical protein